MGTPNSLNKSAAKLLDIEHYLNQIGLFIENRRNDPIREQGQEHKNQLINDAERAFEATIFLLSSHCQRTREALSVYLSGLNLKDKSYQEQALHEWMEISESIGGAEPH